MWIRVAADTADIFPQRGQRPLTLLLLFLFLFLFLLFVSNTRSRSCLSASFFRREFADLNKTNKSWLRKHDKQSEIEKTWQSEIEETWQTERDWENMTKRARLRIHDEKIDGHRGNTARYRLDQEETYLTYCHIFPLRPSYLALFTVGRSRSRRPWSRSRSPSRSFTRRLLFVELFVKLFLVTRRITSDARIADKKAGARLRRRPHRSAREIKIFTTTTTVSTRAGQYTETKSSKRNYFVVVWKNYESNAVICFKIR